MTILWQVLLGIYAVLLTIMIFFAISTHSINVFRKTRIKLTNHLTYIIISAVLIVVVFLIAPAQSYQYRISTLIVFLSPTVLIQLTFNEKIKGIDKENYEYFRIKSLGRLINRIATSAYIIFIALTLTYLQKI